ncbi:hypothetical protein I4F81_008828 [Pyropia yezoensis]|uniref:Uncharacterized protein n=1 Tax=Pyropia yezoensis TaxID=2788 RepID=A0ACC3C8V4_PYRYE|nr:hypothetical protein I4F81_008828 [Neopyropia yezoensis]|eukprot:contig_35197_g8450
MADLCSPDSSGNNVGVAFGLVTASGLATSLGAAAAFWMPLPKPGATSNPWLAASLGAAAGVMVYVSFVEIFVAKSVTAFENCIDRSEVAYLYATLCFFGGVLLTIAFDRALHLFERWAQRRLHAKRAAATAVEGDAEGVPAPAAAAESVVVAAGAGEADVVDVAPASGGVVVATPVIHHQLPMSGVDGVEVDAEAARSRVAQGSHPSDSSNWTDEGEGTRSSAAGEHAGASSVGLVLGLADDDKARQEAMQPMADSTGHGGLLQPSLLESAKAKKDLIRMGMFAGIALAAHNFPEGLATFIAALQDPGVGVSVAVAIGIHNIPEGVAVAMPIYYATGSKPKAFFWASLSGMTELIGAALGWVVLRKVFNQLVYGILFGLISGMMVYIALKELLPTAHRYDPEDKVVTISLIGGMIIMAASLVLFLF